MNLIEQVQLQLTQMIGRNLSWELLKETLLFD